MFKKTEPLHDVCSHTADALRTFSEAHEECPREKGKWESLLPPNRNIKHGS